MVQDASLSSDRQYGHAGAGNVLLFLQTSEKEPFCVPYQLFTSTTVISLSAVWVIQGFGWLGSSCFLLNKFLSSWCLVAFVYIGGGTLCAATAGDHSIKVRH